jgi:type I restriction enzyme S subunit
MLAGEADRVITLLKERRSALISAAVTGKIDVRGLAPVAPQKVDDHRLPA